VKKGEGGVGGWRSGVWGRKEFGQYCKLILEPQSTGSGGKYSLAVTIGLYRRKMRKEEEGVGK